MSPGSSSPLEFPDCQLTRFYSTVFSIAVVVESPHPGRKHRSTQRYRSSQHITRSEYDRLSYSSNFASALRLDHFSFSRLRQLDINKMAVVEAIPQEQVAALQQQGEYAIKSSDAQPALG